MCVCCWCQPLLPGGSVFSEASSWVYHHGRTLEIQQTPPSSAPAPPGNNFTCMLLGSCGYLLSTLALFLAMWTATVPLHGCHCARFRYLRTIRILTALNFPRCGVLAALPAAVGWRSPWHFAVRPVAATLANHLWLRSLLVPVGRRSHATKLNFSAPERRSPRLPVKHFLLLRQQSADVPTFKAPPGEGAAAAAHNGLWVMKSLFEPLTRLRGKKTPN